MVVCLHYQHQDLHHHKIQSHDMMEQWTISNLCLLDTQTRRNSSTDISSLLFTLACWTILLQTTTICHHIQAETSITILFGLSGMSVCSGMTMTANIAGPKVVVTAHCSQNPLRCFVKLNYLCSGTDDIVILFTLLLLLVVAAMD